MQRIRGEKHDFSEAFANENIVAGCDEPLAFGNLAEGVDVQSRGLDGHGQPAQC